MRIKLDLTAQERLALDRLAESNFRRPSEHLRWLLMQEAQQQGLLPKMNDCTGQVSQGETGAIVQANP